MAGLLRPSEAAIARQETAPTGISPWPGSFLAAGTQPPRRALKERRAAGHAFSAVRVGHSRLHRLPRPEPPPGRGFLVVRARLAGPGSAVHSVAPGSICPLVNPGCPGRGPRTMPGKDRSGLFGQVLRGASRVQRSSVTTYVTHAMNVPMQVSISSSLVDRLVMTSSPGLFLTAQI
jgi:hypothetical protein